MLEIMNLQMDLVCVVDSIVDYFEVVTDDH